MNVKRCLSFLVVCIFTFFLALVPTSFFGVNPDTGLPIFTLTQQRVIAIFVFTAMMWILEVIPTWTTSVVAIRNPKPLLDVVNKIDTIATTEVVQVGITSRIHIIAVNTKMAITLC